MFSEPLAYRMRPKTLDEIVGQKHLIGEGKFLQRLVAANRLSSMILHGPPGTGKTTIAHVLARMTDLPFHEINAVSAGKKDMETIVGHARFEGQSIIFVDEVHRFNKAQQDFLLPYMENGLLILIGATTENPHFEINHAIKSRCTILELTYPTVDEIKEVLQRALEDKQRGLGTYKVVIEESTLNTLAEHSGGDVRSALNGLELAVLSTTAEEDGSIIITDEIVRECVQQVVTFFIIL
ncbi:MAG TPA: AAA family ATPase, partial [Bacilli bacterium]|nr:AAA family ATPase [Bacilli bacterium]